MKLTVNEVYGILNNQHELDDLRNDAALKFFRIAVKIEELFKAEFKAVDKAKKQKDQEEVERLAQISKDVDCDPLTQDELKEYGLLSVRVLRIFKPIIDV